MKEIYVDSGLEGKGVFANKDFKKGEKVLTFKGETISYKEAFRDKHTEEHCLQVGENRYIAVTGFEQFVNHSCDPNTGLINVNTLIAIRDIGKDEEITFDYSTCIADGWEMKCTCKSKNCRKIIKDFKYLPKKIKEKYAKLKIVPRWITEV